MRSTSAWEKRGGRTRSSSPTVTSVGRRDAADPVGGVVLDQRLRGAAERIDGLRVRACLGGREPFVHDPLVPDPGREAPEIDGDQEVADRVGLLGRPHPVAEDLVQEPVAPAPGAVQDDAAYALRVGERELLRDCAAHRRPDDVRALETERLHEGGRVGGEVGDRGRARPESPSGRRRGCRRS